jgi:hypothetical protein
LRIICILGLVALGGAAMEKSKKLIDEIPVEVREYLSSSESLSKAAVQEKYPDVRRTLQAPATREAIVRYLGSKEPWAVPALAFTVNALAYLVQGANAKELAALRPLMDYPDARVRLRVCEYTMAVYYPARDKAAMATLFQRMLADPDEVVRVQGASWIEDLHLVSEMRAGLEEWTKSAREHKWDTQESYQIIQGLLGR